MSVSKTGNNRSAEENLSIKIQFESDHYKPEKYLSLKIIAIIVKIIKIEDSTHWVMQDAPDMVVSSIREFAKK